MKKRLKDLSRSLHVQRLLCALLAGWLHLIHRGIRWQIKGEKHLKALEEKGGPFIVVLWHARLIGPMLTWPLKSRTHALVSSHGDGRFIGQTLKHFHYDVIWGSSNRDATQALREMARQLKAGNIVTITPDGPRGPRMRMKESPLHLAARYGAPILPISYSVTRGHLFSSWDRFLFPFPFGRGIVRMGEPLEISTDSPDFEPLRQDLEARLNHLTAECDRETGQKEVLPADPDDIKKKRT